MRLCSPLRASVSFCILGIIMMMSLSIVNAVSAQVVAPNAPLQSVDYVSYKRQNCEGAFILRLCLLSLVATVVGGTPPIHVNWYLSNGTRLRGTNVPLAIEFGGTHVYGVCLSARDASGRSVIGGHWEYGINYWSDLHQSERHSFIRARASISPPCTTVGTPVMFNGSLDCATDCAPSPILPTWVFGDGSLLNGTLAPVHQYEERGVFFATLLGTDSYGRTNYSLSSYPIIVLKESHGSNVSD